jgi:hypothetical protein
MKLDGRKESSNTHGFLNGCGASLLARRFESELITDQQELNKCRRQNRICKQSLLVMA